MSPQLVALLMCVMLGRLVRVCSETQPEEKEENCLDVHFCSIFDQYLLFTNCSSKKQRNYWSFMAVLTAWQVWVKYFTCCYTPFTHPAPLSGETFWICRRTSLFGVKFSYFCRNRIVYICLFSIVSLPLYSTDNRRGGVLTAGMGRVSLFLNWLWGQHLFSAQLHLFAHIHCFQWCSAEEKKENKT